MGGNDGCVLGLIAPVVILAQCSGVPLLMFSIDWGGNCRVMSNGVLIGIFIWRGEPELYENPCLPKKRLSKVIMGR